MKKKPIEIKIAFLSDKQEGNTDFITNFLEENTTQKNINDKIPHYISETKIDANNETTNFKIKMYYFNEKNDKYNSIIVSCNCVFILFDMTVRKSFERLLDDWILYVRDTCKFKELVIILGNYFKENDILTTDKEEIEELIETSEIKGIFIDFGKLDNIQKKETLDNIIRNCCLATKDDSNGNDCLIF